MNAKVQMLESQYFLMSSKDPNPYVALREAKIARNEARLAQLGLLKRPNASLNSSDGGEPRTSQKRRREVAPKQIQEPVRRSKRISQQTDTPNYKEVSLPVNDGSRPSRVHQRVDDYVGEDDAQTASSAVAKSIKQQSTPAANSVRSIDLNVNTLVIGENGILGKTLEQPGKEHVIHKSFELASSPEDQRRLSGVRLSFNKYCGVLEWNNSIFLWVNLGSKDNSVVNDFLDGGQQITWFGGSRMYDDSPVIHKLLQYGRDATKESSKIVLWCRKYDGDAKKFTPYICLGRLSYHSHSPGSHPLSFVWNLVDANGLKDHADVSVRETYENLITV